MAYDAAENGRSPKREAVLRRLAADLERARAEYARAEEAVDAAAAEVHTAMIRGTDTAAAEQARDEQTAVLARRELRVADLKMAIEIVRTLGLPEGM